MSQLGFYKISDNGRENIEKLAALINKDINFVEGALKAISTRFFNSIITQIETPLQEELKTLISNPEIFKSTFRTKVPEALVNKVYTQIHNEYIDLFITECGGNYSDEVLEQIKALKI